MELGNQETARDMLENENNAQHRDFHLDTDNNETISISHMQRDDIQTRSFFVNQKQMEEFLKQSKEREEASQRLVNSMQSEIQQLKSRITERPENIDIPTNSQAPKYTTPKFSGIIEDDKYDFDTWVCRSRRYLLSWQVSESVKITATLMNITSPAIEILQPFEHELRKVEDIYAILKPDFQVSDKFGKLEALKQIGQGPESIQVLAVKVKALTESACTAETRDSQVLKYFIQALRPEVRKKIANSIPTNIEQAIVQAKWVEQELNKITVNKEPTLKEVKIAQVSQESISNKNYEALKQQLSALSNVVSSIQQQPHQYNQQHNQSNSFQSRNHSNEPAIKCFHCKKNGSFI